MFTLTPALRRPLTGLALAATAALGLAAAPAPTADAGDNVSFSFGISIGDQKRPYYHRPHHNRHVDRSVTSIHRQYHAPRYHRPAYHTNRFGHRGYAYFHPRLHRPGSVTIIKRHSRPGPAYCPPAQRTVIHHHKVIGAGRHFGRDFDRGHGHGHRGHGEGRGKGKGRH